jgi:hypothetical protein
MAGKYSTPKMESIRSSEISIRTYRATQSDTAVVISCSHQCFYKELRQFSRYNDGLRAGRPGFKSRQGKIFLFYIASRPTLGPNQNPVHWTSGDLSPELKRPGREVDRSSSTGPEVKNDGATSLLPRMSSWHSS